MYQKKRLHTVMENTPTILVMTVQLNGSHNRLFDTCIINLKKQNYEKIYCVFPLDVQFKSSV